MNRNERIKEGKEKKERKVYGGENMKEEEMKKLNNRKGRK